MKSFVVRVYRQDEEDRNQVVGIVEHVEENRRTNFSNMEELIMILCSRRTTGQTIDESGVRLAINNRKTDNGPDWGEIRFETGSEPGKGEKGEREN